MPGGRPLKLGVTLPICERESRTETPHWSEISRAAQLSEQAGFDSVWFEDHLLFRHYEGQEEMGCWEAMSMLAAAAAVTSRIELGTLVAATTFRNPALTAKIADTLDEISDGRFILGLGAGWNAAEYKAFGFPFDHLYSRFKEALTIIHSLLRAGYVDFEGTYYSARDCALRPRGPRPSGPPILIGAGGEKMLRLVAEYADMWNVWSSDFGGEAADIARVMEPVDAACHATGRDPATLLRTGGVIVEFADDLNTFRPWPDTPGISGSPEQMAEQIHTIHDAGFEHLQIWFHPNTLDSIERFVPVLEIIKQETQASVLD
jgi:probable F420-dependent oxidoreductase